MFGTQAIYWPVLHALSVLIVSVKEEEGKFSRVITDVRSLETGGSQLYTSWLKQVAQNAGLKEVKIQCTYRSLCARLRSSSLVMVIRQTVLLYTTSSPM